MIAAASIQRHNADVFQAQRAAIMLHPEMFDAYRKMTPSERLTLTLEMSMTNYRRLWAEPPDVVARRFEVLRLQNDERKRRGGDRHCQDSRARPHDKLHGAFHDFVDVFERLQIP
jgi:hypothetical protein